MNIRFSTRSTLSRIKASFLIFFFLFQASCYQKLQRVQEVKEIFFLFPIRFEMMGVMLTRKVKKKKRRGSWCSCIDPHLILATITTPPSACVCVFHFHPELIEILVKAKEAFRRRRRRGNEQCVLTRHGRWKSIFFFFFFPQLCVFFFDFFFFRF